MNNPYQGEPSTDARAVLCGIARVKAFLQQYPPSEYFVAVVAGNKPRKYLGYAHPKEINRHAERQQVSFREEQEQSMQMDLDDMER